MAETRTLKIGTRGSDLALAQAREVAAALEAAHPGLGTELCVIETTGDRRLDLNLAAATTEAGKVPKGLFTKELELALTAGEIDVAVHSLKDLPTEMATTLRLVAVLPRERVEDVLVLREPVPTGARGLNFLPTEALIATGSLRRIRLLRHYRPDLRMTGIRGNVPTRLRKLAESPDLHGTVLAYAGLHRLGLIREENGAVHVGEGLHGQILDAALFPPAPGQGAIAMQARADDAETLAQLGTVNHAPTWAAVTAERAFLQGLGGGCQTPVATFTRLDGALTSPEARLILRALVFPGGAESHLPPRAASLFAPPQSARELGAQLATETLAAFGGRIPEG